MTIKDNDFPVSEIFESIQGEGNFAGTNSLFIRFQLCNLTCTWCDTKYTWTRFSDRFEVHNTDELKVMINQSSKNHVIFTGGEPSLYRLDLLAENRNKKFHVESNGTIIPTLPLNLTLKDGVHINRTEMNEKIIEKFNWVISPKLSNSKQEINRDAVSFWSTKKYAIFKFIVENISDMNEVENFTTDYRIDKKKVYLGFMGTTVESQLRTDLADEIIKRGFHYSPRLHLLFWGQKRGK